jgi:hypothetical protein
MNEFGSLSDDFGVSVYVNTKMELPEKRETVLHFFDSLQKNFPDLTDFETRENGDFVLEEDRDKGSYRWVSLERQRFCSGYVNPPDLAAADRQNERVLETAPFHLDFSPLDCESLDVLFTFNFLYTGNHDEVVAEALGLNTTLESVLQMPGSKVLDYKPTVTLALDEHCRLQCQLSVETRSTTYQVRTNQFAEAPISVYFTVRQYWGRQKQSFVESYRQQRKVAGDLVEQHVIPAVLKPLSERIANQQ